MEIPTGASGTWEFRMRGDIGVLSRNAETMGSVRGSARIPFDRLEFQARPVGPTAG